MTGPAPVSFYSALEKALRRRGLKPDQICPLGDPASLRVLKEYGAMFVASPNVMPPPVCIFTSEEEVVAFQERAGIASAEIGGTIIELQPAAMEAYLAARQEALREGLDITHRGGAEAARRRYSDSVRLWETRFSPALDYWMAQGRLSAEQVKRLRGLPLKSQIAEVLELERSGIYFSKNFAKSILYSVAAPGASQHIAMLALDVEQFAQKEVRRILARHGWFQTVWSDLPHFTYLGLKEDELPSHGLRSVVLQEQLFWIPNVDEGPVESTGQSV